MDTSNNLVSNGRAGAWIIAFRPAFHTVGVFPYTLGALISWSYTGNFDWNLWGIGLLAVMLIMISTHLSGECFDHMEDSISWAGVPSKFAGGAGVLPRRMLGREALFYGSLVSAGLAILIGLVIWIGFETGPWTIPFGLIGILGGFFYSSPPFRWVATGFGEIWILVCYGFLTVAVGLYLPFGQLTLLSTLVSVPIAATIFNVIFANEYPDYESDRAAHKTNLLSRVGRSRGAWIYVIFSIAGNISFVISMFAGVPMLALACYTLPFIISVYCVLGFIRGDWRNRDKLEMICGLTILVNLTTTLSYLMAFALG